MREHGTRACYVFGPEGGDHRNGCRCEPCTEATRIYERERYRAKHRPDGGFQPAYVDASDARRHLLWLSSVGVGRRAVAAHSGVALSSIHGIRSGRTTKARPATIDAILAVGRSAASPNALVDATDTWAKVDELRAHGWTKAAISRAIGQDGRALQLGRRRVTARNARKVADLHASALLPILRDRENQRHRRARYRQNAA